MGAAKKLTNESVMDRIEELPTLPSVVYEVTDIINDPSSNTADVEAVMSKDPSLTTKVLRMANSAYYGIPGGVSTLSRAIGYIGYDTVQQLVFSASVIDAFRIGTGAQFDPTQFWRHSLGVAMASETISNLQGRPNTPEIFTGGLIHDIGKLVLFTIEPETLETTISHALKRGMSLFQAEMELELPTHTMIGEQLAMRWKLPNTLQGMIRHHHDMDLKSRGKVFPETNAMIDIVFLGNRIVHALKFGNSGHKTIEGIPQEMLARLNLDSEALKKLISEIKIQLESADHFLKAIGA